MYVNFVLSFIFFPSILSFIYYPSIADFDFDPSPLEATFQPDLAEACVDVRIIKDEQVGENKEVFGLRVSAATASPGIQVSAGSRAQTIVLVNDVPGEGLCTASS